MAANLGASAVLDCHPGATASSAGCQQHAKALLPGAHQGSGFQSNSPVRRYWMKMSLPHTRVSRRLQGSTIGGGRVRAGGHRETTVRKGASRPTQPSVSSAAIHVACSKTPWQPVHHPTSPPSPDPGQVEGRPPGGALRLKPKVVPHDANLLVGAACGRAAMAAESDVRRWQGCALLLPRRPICGAAAITHPSRPPGSGLTSS